MTADESCPESTLQRLYFDHADSVHRFARVLVGPSDAEDIVAETYLVAWRRVAQIPPGGELPWLLAVARNTARTHLRGLARRAKLADRLADLQVSHLTDPTTEFEDRQQLIDALSRLTYADQELLLAWAWFDLSTVDGARVMNCSRSAFAVRLHRARRRLHRLRADSTISAAKSLAVEE